MLLNVTRMASYNFLHPPSPSETMTPSPIPMSSTPRTSSHRPRPAASRRTNPPHHPSIYRQNNRAASLAPLQIGNQSHYFTPPTSASTSRSATPPPKRSRPMPPTTPVPEESPRFSRLLSSVLGSPFLTTSDLPFQPDLMDLDMLEPRLPSPVPSVDFSIIDVDPDDPEVVFSTNSPIPGAYPIGRHGMSRVGLPRSAYQTDSFPWPPASSTTSVFQHPAESPHNPFKTILPRIWDAISSPGRGVLNFSSSSNLSTRSRSPSPPPRLGSWYLAESAQESSLPARAKGKARAFFSKNGSKSELNDIFDYSDLAPLDGEEGELIDDEACFVDVRAVTGIDILSLLPPELALHILSLLCPPPLDYSSSPSGSFRSRISHYVETDQIAARNAILACRAVSHTWRRLASDNATWRALFLGRWGIDLRRAGTPPSDLTALSPRSLGPTWSFDWGTRLSSAAYARGSRSLKGKLPFASSKTPSNANYGQARHDHGLYFSSHRISYIRPPASNPLSAAPLQLDWRLIYRERVELDGRWAGTVPATDFHDSKQCSPLLGLFNDDDDNREMEMKENVKPWEPEVRRMEGHTDSVYCVEFDSKYIITGSRDRTIKVWSLKTGEVLGTFRDAHNGSVLCLKFEKDWSLDLDTDKGRHGEASSPKGLLVSGSSDCSICVWEMEMGGLLPNGEGEIKAVVKATLEGHEGGVLDIRMDDKWIVSCSKDASIRVWDRQTLSLARVLRGHEGPVNAIGLQHDRVVSASGDGKLILWDITNGERIRTFEGHDRGLACIEFKDNLIVSGSNDCKIKVWDPWTGECLRTLTGHEGLVRALSFDPKTGRLVSVSYDKTIKVWELLTGKLVREFKDVHTGYIFDVKFDATRIVTTSHDHQIVELDFSAGLDASLFI